MGKEHQSTYWRSLNQLANNDEYKKFVEREFPENATELTDGLSRRNFLTIMGASVALAGLTACRKPVVKILPHSRQPEFMVPGIPMHYATSMPFKDSVTGLLVTNNEGRPTKIEGNDLHPESDGATNSYHQAALLDLYDRDRSRFVRKNGEKSDWESFVAFSKDHFSNTSQRILFISEANSSPTYQSLKTKALSQFSNSEWVTYEPFSDENVMQGVFQAFGQKLRPVNHFDKAKVILSLDADFMSQEDNNVQNVKRYTKGRKLHGSGSSMSRLYVIEGNYSLTGSNADHRLQLKPSQIAPFVYALASKLSESISGLSAFSGHRNDFSQHSWIAALAQDLVNNKGASLLTAGSDYAVEVHAAVAAINKALTNDGATVEYLAVSHVARENQHEKFVNAVQRMRNGDFDTVVLVGTNPVYTAFADVNFASALGNVATSIHLSSHYDETSSLTTWHVNRAHFLEAWGDGYSYEGVLSPIQPMIQPLFDGKSEVEFLSAIIDGKDTSGHELVRSYWLSTPGGSNKVWQTALHDGLVKNTRFTSRSVSISSGFASFMQQAFTNVKPASNDIELVIKPDPKLYDGRFANNPWLQELPDPISKITWDNVALMSANTARKLGLPDARRFGQYEHQTVSISTGSHAFEIAAWVLPGHADDTITVYAGYGRTLAGRVVNSYEGRVGNISQETVGVDVYKARTVQNPLFIPSVRVSTTGNEYEIATTQDHHSMEGRPFILEGTLAQYNENPSFAPESVAVYSGQVDKNAEAWYTPGSPPINLHNTRTFPEREPQWGMTIDLNSCIGCGVCSIACQAENNIPVVGKREVRRGREMHWIRTDRYFNGDDTNPTVAHQPVPCMHCEQAPCEQVCPVAATTHSDDGLNQMTYNRCIGTRYCANNCPYKVRRFNFFNYPKEFLTTGEDTEVIQMAMNPDVTIRFRGVMEKCTYCVQRISRAKINTRNKTGYSVKPPDGAVKTACQQACPADAIEFGDLTDTNSRVSVAKRDPRNYFLLEELNVRPRTSYLAKVRNVNPNIA